MITVIVQVSGRSYVLIVRWFGDGWAWHLRHHAVCAATNQHMVRRPGVQHGVTTAVRRREGHALLPAELSGHGAPTLGAGSGRKPFLF